jgi:hypothetical protein
MNYRYFRIFILFFVLVFYTGSTCFAQRHVKVREKKKIVAYDHKGKEIDSLAKDLTKGPNMRLDQLQVDIRELELLLQEIELGMEKNPANTKLAKKKEKVIEKKQKTIVQLDEIKHELAEEYYLIIEATRDPEEAHNALDKWRGQGFDHAFIFHNHYRGWYYICENVYSDKATLFNEGELKLKRMGIPYWIYYWADMNK